MWQIIANKDLIELNQDALGIQAKRLFTTMESETPDTDYITANDRCDILVKPLYDGSVAISFLNLSDHVWNEKIEISAKQIAEKLADKMMDGDVFRNAGSYRIMDLWSGEEAENKTGIFEAENLEPYGNRTIRIWPV